MYFITVPQIPENIKRVAENLELHEPKGNCAGDILYGKWKVSNFTLETV